jgi:hypothetical protein
VTAVTILDAGSSLLRPLGVEPRQYRELVRLFRRLGERKELAGNIGMDRHAMQLTTLSLLVPGGFLALFAFSRAPLASLDLTLLAASSFVLLMLLTIEAANSFLNPSEITALAAQPIRGGTYFAAKFTYLIAIVLRAELALNGPASLIALTKPDARWFYPLTHMTAAFGLGIFIALVVCALCGVLFRILPAWRIRGAALWMQLGLTVAPLALNFAQRPMRRWLARMEPGAQMVDWSFLPLTWFHALAMTGHRHDSLLRAGWPLAIGAVASFALVVFGIRSLSVGYMTRIVSVLRSGRTRSGRRAAGASWLGRLAGVITGRPSGRAGFEFVSRVMRRDWQFRRAIVPMVPLLLVIVVPLAISGRIRSPFAGPMTGVGLLPEIIPFVTLSVCIALSYSDHFRGAWIFTTAPGGGLHVFVRGVYLAVWLPFIAVPLTVCFTYFLWHWGLVDAALFTAYGLAVASFLFGLQLFLIETLPFSHAPRADRPAVMLPVIMFGPVAMAVAWFLQGLVLFPHRWLTLAATTVFAGLAVVIARNGLRQLETRIESTLAALGGGPQQMFTTAD